MKKYSFIFYALGLLFLMSSCSNEDNRHRDLINYLNTGLHHFTLDPSLSDDSSIIKILNEVSKYNQYVQESNRNDTDKVDATNYMKKVTAFNMYLDKIAEVEKIYTDTIDLDTAILYHQNYVRARERASNISTIPKEIKRDKSEAILFTLPKIIAALQDTYDPEPSDWVDTSFWQEKGFFIFLANYGSGGHDHSGTAARDTFQTSVILQLATDVVPDPIAGPDRWRVVENQLYNFGDLKPPKIRISNPEHAPR